MNCDAHHLRHRSRWRRPLQQVLIPITHAPMGRSRRRDARQRQGWGEDMFAETRVRILGIKWVQQQCESTLARARLQGVQRGGVLHFCRQPQWSSWRVERVIGDEAKRWLVEHNGRRRWGWKWEAGTGSQYIAMKSNQSIWNK